LNQTELATHKPGHPAAKVLTKATKLHVNKGLCTGGKKKVTAAPSLEPEKAKSENNPIQPTKKPGNKTNKNY
jgi:hypothetical protein